KQITERTRQKIADFGIELLDERFKRSKYNPAVAEKIIERMSSERHQIAARFRAEGRGEAENISGQKESDVASISSTATKNALQIEGKADAEAASIYAAAFNPPDAQELYSFLRSLDVMRAAFEKDTTAVISTNSDLGRMLKSMAEATAPTKPTHWSEASGRLGIPRARSMSSFRCLSRTESGSLSMFGACRDRDGIHSLIRRRWQNHLRNAEFVMNISPS